jgi:hypothetical protein
VNLDALTRQNYLDLDSVAEALATRPAFDICQVKYDGIWTALVVDHKGHGTWYSQTKLVKKHAPTNLEPGLYVGEFMFGQQWATHPSRYGKTYLFDFLWSHNRDFRGYAYIDRWRELNRRVQCAENPNLISVSNVSVSLAEPFWARILAEQYEGLVFRRSSDNYDASLGRVKREVEIDAVAVNLVQGNGKHTGRLGALVCSCLLPDGSSTTFEVGGGFTDPERDDIWCSWPRDKGRTLTAKGKGRFASGALRHPNFKCWNDTK